MSAVALKFKVYSFPSVSIILSITLMYDDPNEDKCGVPENMQSIELR